ncbi:tripartite motif-containing protein 55-like [Gorilla gorilla gorilla]|uniref:tripartite motif-containing protein 55-like n=1 Tax=Gorilla gorilla gorilla TaxID=9595 RepID=UPI00300A1C12
MELLTLPALLLSCSHNFCKQCLELILVYQNCTQVQGWFCCPVCRKDIYLKGRGTNGLQGNILAENILEKLKEVLETLHTGEQNQLTQMCEKRGEIMNLMCLSDEKPICRIFKLSGDHSSHQVAKIADVYTERKASFAEDIQQVLQRSESTAQETEVWLEWFLSCPHINRKTMFGSGFNSFLFRAPGQQRTQRGSSDLSTSTTSTTSTRTMIKTIGNCLISGIHSRSHMVTSKQELEHASELERLQWVAWDLAVPRQLCHQMLRLLQQQRNAIQFLRERTKSSGRR